MKLDFSSDNSTVSIVDNDFIQNGHSENGNAEFSETLRAGIKAAQSGNRNEARHLLLRVTESEPTNENAWMWLASISEYPEELLIFLNNVLDINPASERALEWAKATKSLLAKTFVQRGIEAHEQDRKQSAKQCFMQAIVHDNRNDMAWMWLASVCDSNEEKMAHLHRVLEINPENETARQSLTAVKNQLTQRLLSDAGAALDNGEHARAENFLNEVFEYNAELEDAWLLKARLSDSPEEKIACFEKALEINPESETAAASIREIEKQMAQNLFEKANEAIGEGEREQAQAFLDEVFKLVEDHEEAWILKSRMTDSFAEKVACFEKVLEINPENETAQAGVKLRALMENPVSEAEQPPSFFDEEARAEARAEAEFSADDNFENESFDGENSSGETAEFDAPESEPEVSQSIYFEDQPKAIPAPSEWFEQEEVFAAAPTVKCTVNAEMNFAEPSEKSEDRQVEEQVEMMFSEFQPAAEQHAESPLNEDENSPEFEENESSPEVLYSENYSENSDENIFGENDHSAPENSESEPVFAESAEDHSSEDFAGNEESAPDYYEVDADEISAMSADEYSESLDEPESEVFEDAGVPPVETSDKPQGELASCPFCMADNEVQAFVCGSCRSMLTLSDMEMILAHAEANREILLPAVEQMEIEEIHRGLDSEELARLAIGHINLKNYRKGLDFLQKSSRLDPNNVVIESQANSLAIRLAEIEEKESVHNSMPKDRTIMVVDDSATVRKLISGKLEKCGHIVITAVDGMDAMAKLGDVVPDLILLDITMPRMDGYQVCKLIRTNDTTKEIPIVMISGKDGFFDKVRGRMAGTTGYITKPFGPETLMKMLDTYLV